MIVGIWLTPFYLSMLGQHDYGLWIVGIQILSVLFLVDFGVLAIVPRDVAQLSGHERRSQDDALEIYVERTRQVVFWQTVLICALSLGLFLCSKRISPGIRGPIAIVLAAFALSYPLRLYSAVLTGLQDLTFLSRTRMLLWAVSTVTTVVLLFLGFRLFALAIGWACNIAGYEAVAYLRVCSVHPRFKRLSNRIAPIKLRWRDFMRGLWLSVGQLAQLLITGSDVITIAKFMGAAVVVEYNCTLKLGSVLGNQPQLIASNALPGLSEMRTSESKERLLQVSTSLGQAMLVITGLIICVVSSINASFVKLWVGEKLYGGFLLTILFLLNMMLRQFDLSLAQSLFALNKERPMAIKALVDSLVSLAAALFLVPLMGLPGAPLAYIIGAVLVSLPVNIWLFRRELDIGYGTILKPFIPYVFTIVLGCGIGHLMEKHFAPTHYYSVAVLALAAAAAYAALVLPHIVRTDLGRYFGMTFRTRWDKMFRRSVVIGS